MALPNVNISVNRSGLGLVEPTEDGVMGLVMFVATKPLGAGDQDIRWTRVYNSYEDASNGDFGYNAATLAQIEAFYKEAGSGAKLWVRYVHLFDEIAHDGRLSNILDDVAALIEEARGEISCIGIHRGDLVPTSTLVDNIHEDLLNLVGGAQSVAEYAEQEIMPVSIVVDALKTGHPFSVPDMHEHNYHKVSIVVASENGIPAVGRVLGRLAAIPVQRKISRVKDGALRNVSEAGYCSDVPISGIANHFSGSYHDKGFIVFRTFSKKAGYFFSGDPTATASTDDLYTISRNRVIDKVIKMAYKTYLEELDDDVELTDAGELPAGVVAYLKEEIEHQVSSNMKGEISNFEAIIDPKQNILSGLPLDIELSIIPKGYFSAINVKPDIYMLL